MPQGPRASQSAADRRRRRGPIGALIAAGLGLKLAVTECAFRGRDEGAFPHVNFYVEDPQLGLRLRPGASMQFKLGGNPRTTIHVNASGYRGGDWPEPPQRREIVVVGDSQVFGLGVEDEETLASRLAERTGRPVIDAGVPTYGPREYLEVARELLARRRPETVVVVLDFADDPFELERPNRERHAVWDGWAVRRETAPTEVTQFPGRGWLMSRSHVVYALRRWLHGRDEEAGERPLDPGTPSEGGWEDLVPASLRAQVQRGAAGQDEGRDGSRAQQDGEREEELRSGEPGKFRAEVAGRPGDIVDDRMAVSGRSIARTAALIRHAVGLREDFKRQQRKLARAQAARLREVQAAAATLTGSREAVMAELARSAPRPRPESVFAAYLAEFQALCARHGAELVVVALPLDVQVDGGEWAKYGVAQGPDMRPSQVLLADLVADAEELRIRSVDATAALRAAQPGAFLDGDFHLAARGHAAVAEALAERLARPLPPRAPEFGLPQGTGYAPTQRAWEAVEAVQFAGWATGTAQYLGGWLKLRLSAADDVEPVREIEVREGGSPAAMRMTTATGMTLVMPLAVGSPLTAHLYRLDGGGELQIRWRGERLLVEVTARPEAPERTLTFTRPPDALCRCDVCDEMWGDAALFPACEAAHAGTGEEACEALLGCVRHDPLFAPICPEGQVHAFASNACFTPCDEDNPCAQGRCTPWHGAAVCVSAE